MDDLLSLADTARRLLARPVGARLLVDGLGPAGERAADGVELVDRHGTPVLLCEPGASLAGAARHGRGATLTLGGGAGHTVQFRGRLQPVGRDRVEEREVEQVELRLETVLVRTEGADGVPVPLADYHGCGDPHLASYADALRTHTNRDHHADLRGLAARLSGAVDRAADLGDELDVHGLVAAAQLSALGPSGTELVWVDVDGAHRVRLLFPRVATGCHDLGTLLRQTVCPRDRH